MVDRKQNEAGPDDAMSGARGEGAEDAGRARTREDAAAAFSGAGRPGFGAAGASAMQSAGDIGGGAVNATRDVLHGAIGATEQIGSGLVGGVTHLATDIVGAVGHVGGAAVNTVTHLLVDVVGGVRQVVGAAIGTNQRDMPLRDDAGTTAGMLRDSGRSQSQRTAGPPA